MTREEYVSERKEITEQIDALYDKEAKIQYAYIQEHKEFDTGDKVLLTFNEKPHPFQQNKVFPESKTIAYIKGIDEYNGVIKYKFWKAKKDDSRSIYELHCAVYDKIELIEKAK